MLKYHKVVHLSNSLQCTVIAPEFHNIMCLCELPLALSLFFYYLEIRYNTDFITVNLKLLGWYCKRHKLASNS